MTKFEIKLHPNQIRVYNSPERFKVLICGRRFGKTYLAAYSVILSALKKNNGVFFVVSPSYAQTKIIWRMIKRFLPREYIKKTMEGELYIELINGSLIFAKSGDNPECYDDKTEILTEDGWKLFKDLNKTEMVFTLNPNTYVGEWKLPKRYIDEQYSGDMFAFKNKKQDLLVTPNHRFFIESEDGVNKFKTLDKVTHHDRIPTHTEGFEIQDNENISEDDCAIMGFYLAEGSAYGNNGGDITKRRGNYSVIFCQTEGNKGGNKGDVRSKFKQILESKGYNVHENKIGLYILNKKLWEKLVVLGNAHTKYIPKEYKNLPRRKLKHLFHWMIMGDGVITKDNRMYYYTVSKQLADDFQEIAIKCGYFAKISLKKCTTTYIKGRKINSTGIVYEVSIYTSKYNYFANTKGSYISKQKYSGRVYCVEVENNIVLVRRNGKACFSGNSLRGEGLDGVVLDEAAFLRPEVWNEAIRPALADKMGWAIIISCITPDSYILTPMGITTYSKEINITGMNNVEIPCEKDVFGLDGFNKSSFSWENAETETKRITIEGGYSLEGTLNHPVIAKNSKYKKRGSWTKLEDLNKDCYVALQLNTQIFGNCDNLPQIERKRKERHRIEIPPIVTKEFAYLLGIILGDGYVDDRSITITSKDKEIIDFCHSNPFGLSFYDSEDSGCLHMKAGSDMFVRLLKSIGYEIKLAKYKRIPDSCLKWSKENICALIRGLFDTDGSSTVRVGYKGHKSSRITFVTSSKELHYQLKYLLLNLGIVTSTHHRDVEPTKKVKARSHIYILEIADQIAAQRFKEQIGFAIKRKNDRILDTPDKKYGDRKRIYEQHENYEIKWCRVKKIETGKSKTYDLHIPVSHSFFTNGFISHNTPKGKNWLYELFLRGLDDTQPDYASFRFSSFDNPLVPQSEIEEMSKNLPELSYRQEILAEFIEGGGVVFRNVDKVMKGYPEEPIPGVFYIMGVDLGRHEDFSVISVARTDQNRQVYRERFNQTDWDYIKERIRAVHHKYNRAPIIIDSTGYGDPIYEDLGKEGLNITGININVASKPKMIENLQLMIENNMIVLINDKDASLEFSAYSYTILPSGNVRYESPKGFHDDIVISTALMAMGLQGSGSDLMGEVAEVEDSPNAEVYNEIEDIEDWDDFNYDD